MPEEEIATVEQVLAQTAQPYEASPSGNSVAEKIAEKRAFIAQTIEEITNVRTSLGMETTEADMPPSVARAHEEIEALEKENEVVAGSYSPIENVSIDTAGPILENSQRMESSEQTAPVDMESHTENGETYESLKEKVLSGEITLEKVVDSLIQLDNGNVRYTPEDSLTFLQTPEIAKTFLENEFSKEKYSQLVSLIQFQCAQMHASKESPKAIPFLEDALATTQLFSKPAWSAYVQGTLLYLYGKQIPEGILQTVSEKHKVILTSLNEGLAKNGEPRYTRDY